MVHPLVYNLARYPWQLFGSLTFRKEHVSARIRQSMWRGLVRQQAKVWRVHFNSVRWLLRLESGEATGRLHYHCLIGGLHPAARSPRNCLAMASQWEVMGGGMARVREFSGSFVGLEYLFKGIDLRDRQRRANDYECEKFGKAGEVTLSASLVHDLTFRVRRDKWEADRSNPINEETDTPRTLRKNGDGQAYGADSANAGDNGILQSLVLTGIESGIAHERFVGRS